MSAPTLLIAQYIEYFSLSVSTFRSSDISPVSLNVGI